MQTERERLWNDLIAEKERFRNFLRKSATHQMSDEDYEAHREALGKAQVAWDDYVSKMGGDSLA